MKAMSTDYKSSHNGGKKMSTAGGTQKTPIMDGSRAAAPATDLSAGNNRAARTAQQTTSTQPQRGGTGG